MPNIVLLPKERDYLKERVRNKYEQENKQKLVASSNRANYGQLADDMCALVNGQTVDNFRFSNASNASDAQLQSLFYNKSLDTLTFRDTFINACYCYACGKTRLAFFKDKDNAPLIATWHNDETNIAPPQYPPVLADIQAENEEKTTDLTEKTPQVPPQYLAENEDKTGDLTEKTEQVPPQYFAENEDKIGDLTEKTEQVPTQYLAEITGFKADNKDVQPLKTGFETRLGTTSDGEKGVNKEPINTRNSWKKWTIVASLLAIISFLFLMYKLLECNRLRKDMYFLELADKRIAPNRLKEFVGVWTSYTGAPLSRGEEIYAHKVAKMGWEFTDSGKGYLTLRRWRTAACEEGFAIMENENVLSLHINSPENATPRHSVIALSPSGPTETYNCLTLGWSFGTPNEAIALREVLVPFCKTCTVIDSKYEGVADKKHYDLTLSDGRKIVSEYLLIDSIPIKIRPLVDSTSVVRQEPKQK